MIFSINKLDLHNCWCPWMAWNTRRWGFWPWSPTHLLQTGEAVWWLRPVCESALTHWDQSGKWLRNIGPELRRNGTKISSALQIISSQNWWAEKRKVLLRNCCLRLDIGFFLLTALFVNYFPFYLLTASWSRNPVSELSSNPPPQNWNPRNCEVKLSSFPD